MPDIEYVILNRGPLGRLLLMSKKKIRIKVKDKTIIDLILRPNSGVSPKLITF